ncbi:hypothetical protein HPB50_022936 [Hyalomma asiaticum]|uniref:Uncharacterized protein n=1 Tax=Hyalomma asiaticum TaxID=266040 RepID=A0ACB7T497_HYAAI|nr:hypothetical protein HPB50_022936 [Hyalomma asiaticum]
MKRRFSSTSAPRKHSVHVTLHTVSAVSLPLRATLCESSTTLLVPLHLLRSASATAEPDTCHAAQLQRRCVHLGKALANVPVALAIGIRSAAYRLRRLAFRDAMRPSCERSQGLKSSGGRCERPAPPFSPASPSPPPSHPWRRVFDGRRADGWERKNRRPPIRDVERNTSASRRRRDGAFMPLLFFGARTRVFTFSCPHYFLTRPPGFSLQPRGRLLMRLVRGAGELIQWLVDKWMAVGWPEWRRDG